MMGSKACVVVVALVVVTGLLLTRQVGASRVSRDRSLLSTLRHYVTLHVLLAIGKVYRRKLTAATQNVAQAQTRFLLDRLKENAHTDYGQRHQFQKLTSVDAFRSAMPLTRYEDYAGHVQRMMDGKTNVLTKDQPVIFGVSSGTSGDSKMIPMLKKQQTLFFTHVVSVLYSCLVEAYPQVRRKLKKTMKIFYDPSWRTSKSGVRIGPNSSTPSSQQSVLHLYSTPPPAFLIPTEPEALYVHLLFALKDKHLGMIEGNFSSLVYNALCTMTSHLPQLLQDIRQGTLNRELSVPEHVRSQLEILLQPDPVRADEIEEAFNEGGAVGLCRRVWPDMDLILTVDSGSFAPYGDKLRATFAKGVPVYSAVYASTEGMMGVNLWPEQLPSRYLPLPLGQFLEFLPLDSDLQQQQQQQQQKQHTLLLHELKEGEHYEVVLTNSSGLYRYRLGDVVKVTGFYNQCPIFEFQYRIGQFLNVRGEKTSEALFYQALTTAVDQWPAHSLLDYCCVDSLLMNSCRPDPAASNGPSQSEDVVSCVPCYHVFLEVSCKDGHTLPSEDQKRMIDKCLCDNSYVYSSFRKKGSIDVIKVHFLRQGTFKELRHYAIEITDASYNQFKVPRVLTKPPLLEFLLAREL